MSVYSQKFEKKQLLFGAISGSYVAKFPLISLVFFSKFLARCYKDIYVSNFFPHTARF